MLDERLKAVAAAVRPGSRVADIGTDHGYLPVYLVNEGICPRAIAADLRPKPLEAARFHVQASGLSDRIDLRLGDGLTPVAPDETDDVVIAGMGGETIAGILEAAAWVRDSRLRFVLQPMSRAEELRRYLLYHGFSVTDERLVRDGRHLYPVIVAAYTAAPLPPDDLPVYAGAFTPEEGRPYRRMMVNHLRRKALGLSSQAESELLRIAEQLEIMCEEEQRDTRYETVGGQNAL